MRHPKLKGHFSVELFKFLKELKKNNQRSWFDKNKARYEEHIKQASLAFITDMRIPLELMAHSIVADPRSSGGSLFRIYRDVRFAKDKSPYKTHVAMQFRHRAGKDAHAPGFYLHLEPGKVFCGGGVWHPDARVLYKIREAIASSPVVWKKLTRSAAFKRKFSLQGERLKRAPRDFDPQHPLIEDIKMKDFFVLESFSEKEALASTFLPKIVHSFEEMVPLMRFLAESGGYSW